MTPRRRLATRFGATLLGLLLVQLAWILVVPPFGGLDEHEHAYKAAAVARGDWSASHEQSSGWGELVRVPPSLVDAAHSQCELLTYVSADSCVAGPVGDDGLVRIASSAARYNPVYYALVGPASLHLDGFPALYAMRIVSALLCALLVACAVTVTPARTPWPRVAVLLTLTPTTLYSTSIVAPNGLEICAAVLLWASLLALRRTDLPESRQGVLVGLAALASVPLLTVRTLGPLWWLLIVLIAVVLLGRERTVALTRLRAMRLATVPVALAGVYGVAWDLLARSNAVPSATTPVSASAWKAVPGEYLIWFFQTVGAMPFRNQTAPLGVYAIAYGLIGTLVCLALARASSRERILVATVFVLASAIGLGVTVVALPHSGFIWQGRYFLPLTMGVIFLAAGVFERRTAGAWASGRLPTVVAVAALVVTHVVSQLHVLLDLESRNPLRGTGHWLEPSPWLVVALTAGGAALLLAGCVSSTLPFSASAAAARTSPAQADVATQRSSTA